MVDGNQPEKFTVYEGTKLKLRSSQYGIDTVRTVVRATGPCVMCGEPTVLLDEPLEGGWQHLCLTSSSLVVSQEQHEEIKEKMNKPVEELGGRTPIGFITKIGIGVGLESQPF